MKNIIILSISFFTISNLSAQLYIPIEVAEAFSEIEPNESNPFWESRENAYVAMFPHEDGLKKVFINEQGEWIETRTRIEQKSLPVGVARFIDDYYSEADLSYIGRVDQPNSTIYRVESEFSSSVVIKLLSKDGVLLQESRIDYSLNPN